MRRTIIGFLLFFLGLTVLAQDIPYYPSPGISEVKLKLSRRRFQLFNLKVHEVDPATKQSLSVETHYFRNRKNGKLPLLVVVPPVNGLRRREHAIAKCFIKQGYHVVVLEPVKHITDGGIPISEFQNTLLSFVGAVRSVIDVMIKKEEVDSNNVFIWGSSFGAIYSTIAFGVDKRINAAILVVGGGSLPDIVAESNQRYVHRYKKTRMKEEGLATDEEFRNKLKENLTIDPVDFAKLRSREDVYFIMALKDKSVPTQYQELLFEAFMRTPNKKRYKLGHPLTLLLSHFTHHRVYADFFNKRLRK